MSTSHEWMRNADPQRLLAFLQGWRTSALEGLGITNGIQYREGWGLGDKALSIKFESMREVIDLRLDDGFTLKAVRFVSRLGEAEISLIETHTGEVLCPPTPVVWVP